MLDKANAIHDQLIAWRRDFHMHPEIGFHEFRTSQSARSLEIVRGCKVEPGMVAAKAGDIYQFMRVGYFCCDPDSARGTLVFNRTVGLRDTWAKVEKSGKAGQPG